MIKKEDGQGQTGREIDPRISRQTDKQAGRQANRQTLGRQTERRQKDSLPRKECTIKRKKKKKKEKKKKTTKKKRKERMTHIQTQAQTKK